MLLLYYSYATIGDLPGAVQWHKSLCHHLDLRGRVRVSPEGLNVLLDGAERRLRCYCDAVEANGSFGCNLDFKLSSAGEFPRFPKLSCKASSHVVEMGVQDADARPQDGGEHLSPAQWHELLSQSGGKGDIVLLDARNIYESKIGNFQCDGVKTLTPDLRHFAQFPAYVDSHLDELKGKRVMMYCTGGVRCERASSYLALKNVAQEVMQLKGGICRYLEEYNGQPGFYAGKNFVFDYRRYEPWHDDTVVGRCDRCARPWDNYDNGPEARCQTCRVLLLLCDVCRAAEPPGAAPTLLCGRDRCDGDQIQCGCGCRVEYRHGPICKRTGFFTRLEPTRGEQRAARERDVAKSGADVAKSGAGAAGVAGGPRTHEAAAPAAIEESCFHGVAAALARFCGGRRQSAASGASAAEAATAAEAQLCFDVVNSAFSQQYGVPRYRSIDKVVEAFCAGRMVVVRDAAGSVVGCAEHSACEAGSALSIGPVAIGPQFQGAGHGTALLDVLERRARCAGCCALEAEVRRGGSQGARLLQFYRRAGYEPRGPRNRDYALLVKRLE